MVHGKVMYVDLMDHKGPYVYAVSALAYLLSRDDFTGMFFIELVSMFFFLLYAWKTVRLYTKNEQTAIWALPLLSFGVAMSKSFVHGGSTEELAIGIYAYALYSILRFQRRVTEDGGKSGLRMETMTMLLNGVFAGVLFWSKFTMVGIYIGWIMVVFGICLRYRNPGQGFRNMGVFLLGMLAATVPWIVYFGLHGQIGAWLRVYLWNNIFGYSTTGDMSLLQQLGTALLNTFRSIKDPENLCYGALLMAGGAGFCMYKKHRVSLGEKLSVVFLGGLAGLGIYVGGAVQDYYGLPLAAFATLGLILLGNIQEWIVKKLKKSGGESLTRISNIMTGIAATVIFALGVLLSYRFSSNVYLLEYGKEDMAQYRFAEIVQASEDESLLNYGFMDGGFYTVLDQVPVVPHFCRTNIYPDEIMAQQNLYIEQRLTNWVVAWKDYVPKEEELVNFPVVSEYYDLVDYVSFPLEGAYRTYALYRRK